MKVIRLAARGDGELEDGRYRPDLAPGDEIDAAGAITPAQATSLLDWRGILITFVWKQLPFVTLMTAGAMAALDRSLIEAARAWAA